MNGGGTDNAALRATLARLNDLLGRRDPAIADEFATDAVLSGSDLSDHSRGRDAIAAHFAEIFGLPFTLRFDWDRVETGSAGGTGWIFAEGHGVLVKDEGEQRMVYHLSGVLQRTGDDWHWRVFHGSAPK
jgi:hypothetical protein